MSQKALFCQCKIAKEDANQRHLGHNLDRHPSAAIRVRPARRISENRDTACLAKSNANLRGSYAPHLGKTSAAGMWLYEVGLPWPFGSAPQRPQLGVVVLPGLDHESGSICSASLHPDIRAALPGNLVDRSRSISWRRRERLSILRAVVCCFGRDLASNIMEGKIERKWLILWEFWTFCTAVPGCLRGLLRKSMGMTRNSSK